LDILAQNYGAGLKLVDFQKNAQAAVEEINRWVSEATNDRIQNILDKLDSDTGLVLANAVYFNAGWALPFDVAETEREPFYLLDGQFKNAEMMHQTETFLYTEGEGFQAIELPYSNPDFGMVIILPREGQFQVIEAQLTSPWVQVVLKGFQEHEVILTMPKFRFETPVLKLKKTLSDMGMPGAFSPKADFFGIIEQQSGRKMYIQEVLHKAFIQVDEKKTEAAAASVAIMTVVVESEIEVYVGTPIVMRIDRPFIFLIRDNSTNTILFVGRVMDPVEQ